MAQQAKQKIQEIAEATEAVSYVPDYLSEFLEALSPDEATQFIRHQQGCVEEMTQTIPELRRDFILKPLIAEDTRTPFKDMNIDKQAHLLEYLQELNTRLACLQLANHFCYWPILAQYRRPVLELRKLADTKKLGRRYESSLWSFVGHIG